MQIYVDTDDDLRLSRRILRDIEHRGRDLKGVIAQYTRFVKPAQDRFVTPSRRVADVIVPWNECDSPCLCHCKYCSDLPQNVWFNGVNAKEPAYLLAMLETAAVLCGQRLMRLWSGG
jgi:hypothetical protein